MSKKPPRNGYFYFAKEYQAKNKCSSKQAFDDASSIWSGMNAEQRKPYQDKAKSNKGNAAKLNNLGVNLNIIEKQEKAKQEKEENIKKDIHKTIEIAAKTNVLPEQMFYLLHVHHYFYHEQGRRYFPAEIAIVAFNLRYGIQNTYHKIIVPDHIPLGYKYLAKEYAESNHKITIDPDATPTNITQVANEVLQMINMNNENGQKAFPLYTTRALIQTAENIFDHLAFKSEIDESVFRIYPLEYLFFVLRNAVHPSKVCFPSVGIAELEISKDMFEFKQGISCPFHETTDAPHKCSLSIVHRAVYSMCNHCCKDLGIPLIPGQHVPHDAVVPKYKSERDGTESECGASQHMSIYGDDELNDDDFLEVKDCFETTSNITDSDSDSDFKVVQPRGRYHHYKGSSQGSSSQATSVRIPSTCSRINGGNNPCFGRGRGRGRNNMF